MRDLRVTLVQPELIWEDADANFAMLSALLEKSRPETDLLVLPEMFSSGFSMRATATAQTMDGTAVAWMEQTARQYACVVVGSVNMLEEGRYYNRLLLVSADGVQAQYDKRHLFGLAGEGEVYTAGTKQLVCPVNGWKIHFQICYDLRFPVWARNTTGYDVLINVANWPSRRVYAWQQLLIARAIENQAYVIGVNRVGKDGQEVVYPGNSLVIDPMGAISWKGSDQPEVQTVILRYTELEDIREKLPFLRDRDNFEWR